MTAKQRLILVTVAYIFGVVAGTVGTFLSRPQMPRCQEDQALVGVGDFEAGRWEGYICGPALDDLGWKWEG